MSFELPDEATLAWVEGQIGPFRAVSRYAHDHGYSRLWRLGVGDEHLWLKMHAFPVKWAGEVHALTRWAPELGLAPSVVAWRADPPTVILTERPGRDAEEKLLEPAAEEAMWQAAGAWLARLHTRENDWLGTVHPDGTPNGPTTTDPIPYIRASLDKRMAEGEEKGLLDAAELAFLRWGIREWFPAFAGEGARAIHRDFSPRNWRCTDDGNLTGVIDFEHARWDVRSADLNRWWDYEFLRNPRLIDAFFEAYGVPDDRLNAQIRAHRLCGVGNSIVWAIGVNDIPYAYRNREALHRMMGEAR